VLRPESGVGQSWKHCAAPVVGSRVTHVEPVGQTPLLPDALQSSEQYPPGMVVLAGTHPAFGSDPQSAALVQGLPTLPPPVEPPVHVPAEHVWLGVHARPQAPQLLGSLETSVHTPLQSRRGAAHVEPPVHVPAEHV
jgi:hypothetical protein